MKEPDPEAMSMGKMKFLPPRFMTVSASRHPHCSARKTKQCVLVSIVSPVCVCSLLLLASFVTESKTALVYTSIDL